MRPPGLLSAPSLPSCPQVLDVPVTVKMRTGVQERVSLAHRLLPELRDWGVALVTVGVLVPRFLSLSGSLLSPPNPATFHPHHCTPPAPRPLPGTALHQAGRLALHQAVRRGGQPHAPVR